jgi:hypothetical protein
MTLGSRSNDDRHSWQLGTRLALVRSLSQMRHLEGKTTLTSASLISASQAQLRAGPGTLTR